MSAAVVRLIAEQAAINRSAYLVYKDAEGNVFEIGVCDWEDIKDNPITIDGTQPSLPEIGDLWVDLGECPPQL